MRGTDWTPESLRSFVDKIAEHHDAGRLPFAFIFLVEMKSN
jgi:hypothetical protein